MSFFEKEFDETTKTKLRLYSEYLREWFPVFAYGPRHTSINIIDFFAGPGKDIKGNLGSPLIALTEASTYTEDYLKQNREVNFYFYDKNKKSIAALVEHIKPWKADNIPFNPIAIHQEFPNSLKNHLENIVKPNDMNLILIDQFGVKNITESIFKLLTKHKKNDLLFFISSSAFKRFASKPEFKKYFPNLSKSDVDNIPQKDIHKFISNMYAEWLPKGFISHFSLIKKGNIYGLIFVSNNILGLKKFLESCWKIDTESGENNFFNSDQTTLFNSEKIQNFQDELEKKLINGRLNNERMLYQFTLLSGMLPKHAKDIIKKLYANKKISTLKGKPRNSEAGFKAPRNIIVKD